MGWNSICSRAQKMVWGGDDTICELLLGYLQISYMYINYQGKLLTLNPQICMIIMKNLHMVSMENDPLNRVLF